MEHREYRHLADGADTAVLFIHGINGTPNHFAPFLPLIPSHISVINLLLDGHGGTAKDFSNTSMSRWKAQVQQAVDELSATHRQIFIAAHSMGTLFAIEQAVKNRSVAALFLLSVPSHIRILPEAAINAWKLCFGTVSPNDKEAQAAIRCCGIKLSRNPFLYLGWIPRYLELFSAIRRTRPLLPLLRTPCTVFQSRRDELVSPRSVSYLKEHTAADIQVLEHSGHFYYDDRDLPALLDAFRSMLF